MGKQTCAHFLTNFQWMKCSMLLQYAGLFKVMNAKFILHNLFSRERTLHR